MEIFKQIYDKLINSNNVAIFSHKSPDGDCIGSGIALYYFLTKKGKNVDLYCQDKINENYKFLEKDIYNIELKDTNYDLVVSVDCGDLQRISDYEEFYKNHQNTINIDHHPTNEMFGKIKCVMPEKSSACELLFELISSNEKIDDIDVATALYTGIATDTGCFIHNNTTKSTHIAAGTLLELGIDIDKIHYNLFKKKNLVQLRLLEEGLGNLELFNNNRIAISYLTQRILKKYKQDENVYVGIVNMITYLEETEVGVSMIEQKDNSYRISLRSKGNVDVSVIAQRFGGGGHKMASGCKIYGKAHSVIKKLVSVISEYL